jgi:solute carrier family 25 protein 44
MRNQISYFTKNVYLIAFFGGGAGSIIAQTLSVPIDVVSQHMMLIGQRSPNPNSYNANILKNSTLKNSSKLMTIERIIIPESLNKASNFQIVKYISKEIYKNEKINGFYRGFLFSTFLVAFNSSLWWPFYYFYQSK